MPANLNTVGTDRWQIKLPSDWQQRDKRSGSDYFETSDGTKGAYLTTFAFPAQARSQLENVRELSSTSIAAYRQQMPDRDWQVGAQREVVSGDTILSCIDCFDKATNYRILCIFLSQGNWSARIALHDYDCSDYKASLAYFQPIVDSLSLLKAH